MKPNSTYNSTFFAFLFVCLIVNSAAAQSAYMLLNREYLLPIENAANSSTAELHTNCKPFISAEFKDLTDSFFVPKNKLIRHVFLSGSQNSGDTKLDIAIAPLITTLPGYDFTEHKSMLETRLGAKLNLNFKRKLAIELQAVNNNSDFADYWNNYSQQNKVIPGNGYAYNSKLGYTNIQLAGYLSYSPNSYFNFALGRGKNFFGDGYRSLLLSDFATNYDYLKITTTIWKIKYINLFTGFKDIRNSNGKTNRFVNKYSTLHYLSWNATKRINISFFESVIWQSRDSNNRNIGYDVNYLNPVIFYRPTEYSLGSSDNSLIGASFKMKIFKKQQLFGQLLIDEFLLKEVKARSGWWANKQGFQLGAKSFDVFKIQNLYMQVEWNSVRPYTYAHSNSFQNYAHFNEALAHPIGANFFEYIAILNYQRKLWTIDFKITYAVAGLDSASKNLGQNIYQSNLTRAMEFGNKTTQGIKTDIRTIQLTYSYLINKSNNIRLEAGMAQRFQKNSVSSLQTNYLFLGIRAALQNNYSDF